MNSNTNYNEWSREQKDEFSKQRMLLMKSKNAKLMQRHAEVEQDRIKAEECNSSITSISKVIPKKETEEVLESNETKAKTRYIREWDRGKSDKEYWQSPNYHPSYNNHKSSHFARKGEFNDNMRNYPRSEKKFGDVSDGFKSRSRENYQKNTSSSYYHMDTKTGREEYQNSRWTSQKTYPEEKYKKDDYKGSNSKRNLNKTWSHSYTSGSTSANLSNLKKLEKSAWWPNNKCTDKAKYAIVENWVTSVYISNNLNKPVISKENKDEINMPEKSYSKFDRFERSPNRSDDDDDAGLSHSFMHGQKLDASGNQVFDENESIKKSLSNTNEGGYVKKSDKYSSEAHSGGSNKNQNVRKQRRFDKKEIKSDFKEGFTENKIKDPKSATDDSWSNSVLPKYDKLGCRNDSSYHKRAACNDDDGLWSNTEQSDIQWKLSDDESKNRESVKIVSPKAGLCNMGCSEMFSPQRSKIAKPDDEKNSDGGWSTVSEEGELPNTDIHKRRNNKHS